MTVNSAGPVTLWFAELQVGQANQTAHELWERYFCQLVGLVRMKLGYAPRCAEDEEDVAVSALRSLYSGVAAAQFPNLEDHNSLWAILAKMPACKAIPQRNRQLAQNGVSVITVNTADWHDGSAGRNPFTGTVTNRTQVNLTDRGTNFGAASPVQASFSTIPEPSCTTSFCFLQLGIECPAVGSNACELDGKTPKLSCDFIPPFLLIVSTYESSILQSQPIPTGFK